MKKSLDTRTRILDSAQDLVQRIGANAMSYQDISAAVGIRKASIHHHFPKKEDLLEALLRRYSELVFFWLDDIAGAKVDAPAKLQRYIALFEATLRAGKHDRVCPVGMLGTEVGSLGPVSATLVRRFYKRNEVFLTEILDAGRKRGQFRFSGDSRATAALIFASLEGEALIARGAGGLKQFSRVAQQLMKLLQK